MRAATLLKQSFAYYWRTNLAVVLGVATAVAVLSGALLVGDSVRASLRALFLERVGRTGHVVSSNGFFREQLAADLKAAEGFAASGFGEACPLVVLQGTLTHEDSGLRAMGVQVYGVDERFWKFHAGAGAAAAESPRGFEALLSPSLAGELSTKAGDALLLRIEKPSAIPVESLHGRKEDLGSTIRLSMREALPARALGEFSLRPQQQSVRAVFVSLPMLQRDLEQDGKVNALLVSTGDSASERESTSSSPSKTAELEALLRRSFTLEDLGIRLRRLDDRRAISLETESALVSDELATVAVSEAKRLGLRPAPVLSYLANTIRTGEREIPYSLVAALDEESFGRLKASASLPVETSTPSEAQSPPVILNEWAARELEARAGEELALEYFLWREDGRLVTETARFSVAGVVPIEGEAADRNLVPEYPGITEAQSLADWNPPFPVELARIEARDENYWHTYRTTPKAFISLEAGQRLWQSRFGRLTSLRLLPAEGEQLDGSLEAYGRSLRAALDPVQMSLAVYDVRAEGLEASRGATDFGEYFLYFSFFLVVSALLLTSLFFKLGIEQRLREIGILRAVGFPAARIRTFFLGEAVALTLAGSLLGLAGAYLYGALMMEGLRTWWVGAVGTTALKLHVSPISLLVGAAGAVLAALASIVWTLRSFARHSTRSLLAGGAFNSEQLARSSTPDAGKRRRKFVAASFLSSSRAALVFALAALAVLASAWLGWIGETAGFFGGGILSLVALLCWQSALFRRRERGLIKGAGWLSVSRLGLRNSTHRPARSILCITLIACAAFIVVAVDAFRREDEATALEKKRGAGGYALVAESMLPVVHDPNTTEGREALNLATSEEEAHRLAGVQFARFRVRPGDDASCLNLYQPRNPKIIAPTGEFLRAGRFAFQASLAETPEERENPWLLLNREFADGAIPVAADANSLAYVLHKKLGEDFILKRSDAGSPELRLRFVAALSDSLFQSELLISEKNFLRLFPEQEGFRLFLIEAAKANETTTLAGALEERLSDFGFDVVSTKERLASFHRVENTFLSTFQMLGGLGLVLGTAGLAVVLLRNVLERRRELALLRAFGYARTDFALMVIAENALLLFCGLATGAACALVSIAPVLFTRGGRFPFLSLAGLLIGVALSGMVSSLLATVAALRAPLLPALKAE
ncbi:MAG TPA: ABC transporter permease [Pyrinomonadaceae bacterium]|jgi:ABC-type antimicrobial peptide transport system permease subunit